jgi:hypothetical protein
MALAPPLSEIIPLKVSCPDVVVIVLSVFIVIAPVHVLFPLTFSMLPENR